MTSPPKSVPHGYCHCGCGGKTTIADRNKTATGMVKGQPMRFIVGHRVKPKPVDLDTKPFKIDGAYCRLIPLTRGLHAIVDAADYEWLMGYSWQAIRTGKDWGRGYYAVSRGRLRMHRLIMGTAEEPDHINRIGIDNRRNNLRPCEHRQNTKNATRRKDNSTGYIGVYRKGKKFAAGLQSDGVKMYFGSFDTATEAARVRDAEARKMHREFASTNF